MVPGIPFLNASNTAVRRRLEGAEEIGMTRRRWFDRRFALGLPPEALPDIVERLRGTPARLEERTAGLPRDQLVRRPREAWSIQENAGHLLDLEPLWSGRLDELIAGAAVLRAAALENRRTFEANHHAR